ncbi:MAG: F0F1 ATP synthase subunit B [Clostridiales bacterium]|nr:F0F1 ATP synthase subunit B [Clostridiales bacterium]
MEIVAPLIGFDWTLVMFLVTFLVLFLVLKKFFFEKVRAFMDARAQKVQDQFDSAEAAEVQAREHLAEYKARLDGAELERQAVLKDSKAAANARAKDIIKEANEQADEIVDAARKKMEQERAKFAESMRDQVAMLAIFAAEKIIEKELKGSEHDLIIDNVLKENGGKAWKH